MSDESVEGLLVRLEPLTEELLERGAAAIWLAGSRARGDAGPHSDIDIGVIGSERRPTEFRLHDGVLTSIVWTTAESVRASFVDPSQLGAAVPGWRRAILLFDPTGIGRQLRSAAASWTWADAERVSDAWAAAVFTQLAEEVHKLFNALAAGDIVMALTRRNLVVQRLPLVISIRKRFLYDSERELWSGAAQHLGAGFMADVECALGMHDVDPVRTIEAGLRLYAATGEICRPVLDARQGSVLQTTLALIESKVLR
jgi:hypothetical protein